MMNAENKKQLAIIVLSVGLGLVAAFATSQYVQSNIKSQTQMLAEQYQKKNKALITELELVKRDMKRVQDQQQALAKKQAQMKFEAPQIIQQQPEKKEEKGSQAAFSLRTPYGKRALTVMIDSLSAVGGLIAPGDFVDVLAHFTIGEEGSAKGKRADTPKTTAILFQNVQVLAVGTRYEQSGTSGPQSDLLSYQQQQVARSLYVTIAVSPEEASLLTFVQERGKLQLILRSPTEDKTQIVQVASWDALANFVLEEQGTELSLPKAKVVQESVEEAPQADEVQPFIQIFKKGRELTF